MFDVLGLGRKKEGKTRKKHIAISVKGVMQWAKENKKSFSEAFRKRDFLIAEMIEELVKGNVPIITFYILAENISGYSPDAKSEDANKKGNDNDYNENVESMAGFFNVLAEHEFVHKNQIKISVMGKWYDLSGMVVESIKTAIEETKGYDKFFLNFCVNYNGQEEIIDAFRLILKDLKEGRTKDEEINRNLVKENIYSSYFIPPDIIIETGLDWRYSGMLLWDAVNTKIYYTCKLFPDTRFSEILDVVKKI